MKMNKGLLVAGIIVLVFGLFSWFNGLPHNSSAAVTTINDYVLYGIDNTSGELIRYPMDTGTLTSIGTVQLSNGTVLTGIEATAYVPRNSKIFAFWSDPSDSVSKLVYVNTSTAQATIVGQNLGEGMVTGAAAVKTGGVNMLLAADEQTPMSDIRAYGIYAIQETDDVDFNINGDDVEPSEDYAADVTVLGAAITASGTYDVPVTMKLTVNGTALEPFGTFTLPVNGNVNDQMNPRHYVLPSIYPTGSHISIMARSWLKIDRSYDGTSNSHWNGYMTVDSSQSSPNVITLRDGDAVPNIPAFLDQASIMQFIQKYIDTSTNTMDLNKNQAIYLFELGTTNLNSPAADFQDLVVLVTLAKDPSDLDGDHTEQVPIDGHLDIDRDHDDHHHDSDHDHDDHHHDSDHDGDDHDDHNEFLARLPNGDAIESEDLDDDSQVNGNGDYYNGSVLSVRINPEGTGTQNTLMVDGQAYPIDNTKAYIISGNGLTARIYNDLVTNGKPEGHWWVEVHASSADIEDDDEANSGDDTISHLVKVDPKDGTTVKIMALTRHYDSLAATSPDMFYATSGSQLFRIDPVALTETLVGSFIYTDLSSMEYGMTDLYGYTITSSLLAPVNDQTGALNGIAANIGVNNLGSIIFVRAADDVALGALFD